MVALVLLGLGGEEDIWMELTSNNFYYCTPGAGKLPKSFTQFPEQEKAEEKEEAKSSRLKRKKAPK